MALVLGDTYTREDIHNMLGGEMVTYLPQVDYRIVCGCFTEELNPGQPLEILVGDAPIVKEKAELIVSQGSAIPVFLKMDSDEWQYVGQFKATKYDTDVVAVEEKAKMSKRTDPIAGVLYFEPAAS